MKSDKEKLIDLCTDLLEGRKGIIETSREMNRWRSSIGPENDPDFITFVGIDSQTDHLPVGHIRSQWSAEALENKDKEIKVLEDRHRAAFVQAAQRIPIQYKMHLEQARAEVGPHRDWVEPCVPANAAKLHR